MAGNIAKRANGKWRARYRDESGKEHSRHFDRKIDAQQWLDAVTSAVVTGTYADPQAGRITFAAFFGEWSALERRRSEGYVEHFLRAFLVDARSARDLRLRATE